MGKQIVYDAILGRLEEDPEIKLTENQVIEIIESHHLEGNLWYGVVWDTSNSTPSLTRIGNMDLHRSLPIQSKMRRCLFTPTSIVYLNSSNSAYLEDGTTLADLTGASGEVMVEIPEHYIRFELIGSSYYVKMSEYPLSGFSRVPKMYIGAYEGAVGSIVEGGSLALHSVVNSNMRGGSNTAAWDDTYRTLLGRPRTSLPQSSFRSYARANSETEAEAWHWNFYHYECHKAIYWLFAVEYATLNSQLAFNSAPTSLGYKQGGLGNGVSNLSSGKWNAFNSYNPFIPCGYTNSLGNNSGEIDFTMPIEYDSNGEAHYKGLWDAQSNYVVDDYVLYEDGSYYYCTAEAKAGTPFGDPYWKEVNRTVTKVNSYRGVEMPFGHIYKNVEGAHVYTDGTAEKTYLELMTDPQNYADTYDAQNSVLVEMYYKTGGGTAEGYGKKTPLNDRGDYVVKESGGGSTTYMCDYYYHVCNDGFIGGLRVGGNASNGANCGLGYVFAFFAPSFAPAYFGSRLCYLLENPVSKNQNQ